MLLRHEVAWEPGDLPRLLRASDVQVVHSRRQSGKTTALLDLARQRHGDEFAIVCMNEKNARLVQQRYWEKWTPIQRIDITPPSPKMPRQWPMFVSAQNLKMDGIKTSDGKPVPVYVDEWNMLPYGQQREILALNFIIATAT